MTAPSAIEPCPYRLLIGPLFNPGVLGRFRHDENILIFMPRSQHAENYRYDMVYDWENLTHFNQLLTLLPPHWEPDLVIWWDIVYQSIPPSVDACPYPTALIPGDWNLAYLNTLHFSEIFDVVLADLRLKHYLEAAGRHNIFHWPGFSFDPEVLYREKDTERIYDICFIGNLNEAIHPQRSHLLHRLLQLKDRYRLLIKQGIWGERYRQVLNQSKIVFNFTIAQVMNMRAYEAPACGALLFIEEENQEIRNFLKDREECIYYNADNLIELLNYYLNHEEERARIAEAGYQKIQQFSYEQQFRTLLLHMPEILAMARCHRQQRLAHTQAQNTQQALIALQQFYCGQPQAHTPGLRLIMQRFQALQGQPVLPETLWELNALGSLFFPLNASADHPLLLLAKECFEQGLRLAPDHPIFHYHTALCLEVLEQEQQALWHYSRCVELLAGGQQAVIFDYRNFILPFFKTLGTKLLSLEWEKVSFEAQHETAQPSKYVRLLVAEIWHRIGKILKKQRRLEKAVVALKNALENYSDLDMWIDLIQTELLRGQDELAWDTLQQARQEHPFIVGHLPKILNPSLLKKYAVPLYALIQPYLDIFDELLTLNLVLKLQLQLSTGISHSVILQELRQNPHLQQPQCFSTLTYFLADHPDLPFALRKLIQNCPVYCSQADIPEKFSFDLPFFTVESETEAEFSFYYEPFFSSSPSAFLRSLDRPSQLHQRILGPDWLPFHFPRTDGLPDTCPWPELEDWFTQNKQTVLILTDSLSETELISCLQVLEVLSVNSWDIGYLLWAPRCPGQVQIFCEQISHTAQVFLLEEPLLTQELQWLLQHVYGIITAVRDKGLYYASWALYLGKPVCLLGQPEVIPWPGVHAWQYAPWIANDFQVGLFNLCKLSELQNKAIHTAKRIREFYQKEAEFRQQSLWKLRLYTLGLWDG